MSEDPAKRRYFVIQSVRLTGVVMAILGILVVYGKIGGPEALGYALLLGGLFAAMLAPILLARRWKTPK